MNRNLMIESFKFEPFKMSAFINFPFQLYHTDRNWIPPLKKNLYHQLSPGFPFYQRSSNCHMHFLALSGDKVLGRISAMLNRDLKDEGGTPVGTVGFFECIDEPVVAEKLLSHAVSWLFDNQGLTRIWGPMNFDIWHGYRLMTRGFDQKVFYGEPYNKPYYKNFFEQFGFAIKQQWNSVTCAGRPILEAMSTWGVEPYQRFLRQGYRFEPFNSNNFREGLKTLHYALLQSFSHSFGFTSITFTEFERLFTSIRHALHPHLFVFAYDENNMLAGFGGAFLELSGAMRSLKGRNNFIAKMKFVAHQRHVNRVMFHLVGITQEVKKNQGLGKSIVCHILREVLQRRYDTVLFTLLSKNNQSRKLLREYADDEKREYTLYELNR